MRPNRQFAIPTFQFSICNLIRSGFVQTFVLLFPILLAPLAQAQKLEPAVWPQPRPIDASRLAEFGIRVVEGEFVTLVTDSPASAEVDRLPREAAMVLPRLARYFGIDEAQLDGWRVQACLVQDREKFAAAGLLPLEPHDQFRDGLSLGYEFWVVEQDSVYYRRALFFHELTHSLMATTLGGCGPGWYMEGVAEQMGAHERDVRTGELTPNVIPLSRESAPMWGRVPLVRESPTPLAIDAVMKIDNRQPLPVKSYAWVWALAAFMEHHPRYQERWRDLPRIVLERDFNDRFRKAYAKDWDRLNQEFRLFASTLVYGHDVAREAIEFSEGAKLAPRDFIQTSIKIDRGWQSSGVLVEKNKEYAYQADGRFVIAREPDGAPWPCEAGGITISYHAGQPLGRLLAAVDTPDGLQKPIPLGTAGAFTAPATGTLYLRVNDSPAELSDNEGELKVTISASRP